VTPTQKRVLLFLADDDRHTVDEIARVLQIAADDVTATLRILERLDLVCSHIRLVGGKAIEFWQIWWHRAERLKYCS